MGSRKRKRLESTVAAIQQRWGSKALQRGQPLSSIPHIPTGFASLDKILHSGGIPRQRMTEILGAPSAGVVTLALRIAANAQAEGDSVAYVDLSRTFDPDYAARCQLNLTRLLLVRPHSPHEALEISHSLIASRGVGLLIFDSVAELLTDIEHWQAISSILDQMAVTLSNAPAAMLFLAPLSNAKPSTKEIYSGNLALSHYATIRLLIEKERWIRKRQDIRGYRARVMVLKNKLGPAGKRTTIAITFNGVVRGDGT